VSKHKAQYQFIIQAIMAEVHIQIFHLVRDHLQEDHHLQDTTLMEDHPLDITLMEDHHQDISHLLEDHQEDSNHPPEVHHQVDSLPAVISVMLSQDSNHLQCSQSSHSNQTTISQLILRATTSQPWDSQ